MFMYDTVIYSESREKVGGSLKKWNYSLKTERRGMKVIRSNTEYMCRGSEDG